MARNVEDLALLDTIVTGDAEPAAARPLAGLRFGVPAIPHWSDIDTAMEPVLARALAPLKDAGAVFVEADMPDLDMLNAAASDAIVDYEPRRDLDAYLASSAAKPRFADVVARIASPDVKVIMDAVARATIPRPPIVPRSKPTGRA